MNRLDKITLALDLLSLGCAVLSLYEAVKRHPKPVTQTITIHKADPAAAEAFVQRLFPREPR